MIVELKAGKRLYFNEYKKAYDAGDDRVKKEVLAGCTTLINK